MHRWFGPIGLLTLLAGCEHWNEQAIPQTPTTSELATRALQVSLETETLKPLCRVLGNKSIQEESLEALQRHLARVATLLAVGEGSPAADRLEAARFGVELSGLNHDLIRTDLEASARGISGVVRTNCNRGIEQTNLGMIRFAADWRWPLGHQDEARQLVSRAARFRDNVMEAAPVANLLKPGVVAAANTSAILSLVQLAKTGAVTFARLIAWLREGGEAGASLELVGAGAGLSIQVVAGTQTLVLTEAEVIALAQAGQISGVAVSLLYLARGHLHHIATNKNWVSGATGGPWSPIFEPFFEGAGLQFDDPANLVEVEGHVGPHPRQYHQLVLQRLTQATEGTQAGTPQFREAVLKALRELGESIRTPGSYLNRLVTGAIR